MLIIECLCGCLVSLPPDFGCSRRPEMASVLHYFIPIFSVLPDDIVSSQYAFVDDMTDWLTE